MSDPGAVDLGPEGVPSEADRLRAVAEDTLALLATGAKDEGIRLHAAGTLLTAAQARERVDAEAAALSYEQGWQAGHRAALEELRDAYTGAGTLSEQKPEAEVDWELAEGGNAELGGPDLSGYPNDQTDYPPIARV